MKTFCGLIGGVLLALAMAPAHAAWPERAITLVVPFPAGGGTDVIGRIIGKELGERLGVSVVVENKAGAGGNIGTRYVTGARPDGYTLLMGTTAQTISTAIYKEPGFDLLKQLDAVVTINSGPMLLFSRTSLEVSSVTDLIKMAKQDPGKISYASAGYGTSSHMAAEVFSLATGVKLLHVPYQGAAPAMASIVAGQVDITFDLLSTARPFVVSNKVKSIGMGGRDRSPLMPELTPLSEQSPELLKNFDESAWNVIMVPKGTPVAIQQEINDKMKSILDDEKIKSRLMELGSVPLWKSVSDSGAFVANDIAKWKRVVEDAKIERM